MGNAADTLLFSFHPSLRTFVPTGSDDYYLHCLPGCLAVGGGLPAIWLDDSLDRGSSHASTTFGNTTALSGETDFRIRRLECWALDTGIFPGSVDLADTNIMDVVNNHMSNTLQEANDNIKNTFEEACQTHMNHDHTRQKSITKIEVVVVDGEILEGFLCPLCMKDLGNPSLLLAHYNKNHENLLEEWVTIDLSN